MGIKVLNGTRVASGGGWSLAWDSGDLTGESNDFTSNTTYDIGGVTLTARNEGSATELALGANGLSIEASAAVNWNTTTDTAVGVDIDLSDAGVSPGDDWMIEWTQGTWAGEATSGYKFGQFGYRVVGAGAGINGVMGMVGYESSNKRCSVKGIEEGVNASDGKDSDAMWAQAKDRIRMSYSSGAVQFWAGDGTTWIRLGEYFDAGGAREIDGTVTPRVGLICSSWATFKVRVTRIKIWKRAQP